MGKINKYGFGSIAFDIFNYSFMIIFTISIIYPFWNLLLLSFSDIKSATTLGFHIWNESWYLNSYKFIFQSSDILTAYSNTIFRTVATTLLSLVMCLLGAYPLSKKDLPCRNAITIYFLIPMFFSGGIIPYYMLIKNLGLYDKFLVLIIPGMFSAYNMIIVRNFLQAMEKDLEEAAFIDGATYLDIITKIIVPLSKPVLATVALWTAVANWNAWFDAMIFIKSERILVLQIIIRNMLKLTERGSRQIDVFNELQATRLSTASTRAATILITIGPIIVAYPFLQRYFVKGIMIGSLKG